MAKITTLPAEIIHILLSYCQKSDLAKLARVCRQLSGGATQALYESVEIHKAEQLDTLLGRDDRNSRNALLVKELSLVHVYVQTSGRVSSFLPVFANITRLKIYDPSEGRNWPSFPESPGAFPSLESVSLISNIEFTRFFNPQCPRLYVDSLLSILVPKKLKKLYFERVMLDYGPGDAKYAPFDEPFDDEAQGLQPITSITLHNCHIWPPAGEKLLSVRPVQHLILKEWHRVLHYDVLMDEFKTSISNLDIEISTGTARMEFPDFSRMTNLETLTIDAFNLAGNFANCRGLNTWDDYRIATIRFPTSLKHLRIRCLTFDIDESTFYRLIHNLLSTCEQSLSELLSLELELVYGPNSHHELCQQRTTCYSYWMYFYSWSAKQGSGEGFGAHLVNSRSDRGDEEDHENQAMKNLRRICEQQIGVELRAFSRRVAEQDIISKYPDQHTWPPHLRAQFHSCLCGQPYHRLRSNSPHPIPVTSPFRQFYE